MQPGEHDVYAALVTARNAQLQAQWTRIQIFMAFNAVALPLMFGTEGYELMKMIFSFAALAVHTGLMLSAIRSASWVNFYDQKLALLEELDRENEQRKSRVLVFSSREFKSKQQERFTSRRVFAPIGLVFVLLWLEESIVRCFGIIF